MQVNANTPDTILSLLLEIAQCSFVRVTEFKKTGHIRHQFGDYEHSCLINDASNNPINEHFAGEHIVQCGDHQFTLSILSPQHVHITCTVCFNADALPYSRESDTQEQQKRKVATTQHKNRRRNDGKANSLSHVNAMSIVIELVHDKTLPDFIMQLNTPNDTYDQQQITEPSLRSRKWLFSLLLKTLCVTIENLRLVDHYVELTSDSLTKLRSRTALQTGIDEKIQRSSIALCMVHCIDFQQVNRKFGQAEGDIVLHEIASIIEQHTRIEDICGRFGGALFGVAINASSPEDGLMLANKLQSALHNKVYLQNAIRLTFNIGFAFVSQEEDQIDTASTSSLLINRAEQALKAAQNAAKPSIVQWEPDKFRLDQQEFNYVGGIFTPDNVTNYRNMLLLWDISSIIADEHTFERLLKSVIERLAFTFEFAYAGIVSVNDVNKASITAQQKQSESFIKNYSFELQNATDIIDLQWENYPYQELVYNTAKLAIENSLHTKLQEDGLNSLVIPLGNDTNECFFIMGHTKLLDLTHDTVMLFVGFARQLGKAFKRSQLEDQLNKNLEKQNARLSQELLELKAGMKSSALVFRSPKMQKIVEQTQRAAQTDTTILITGESGTGKEKLINAIHVLSPRNEKPLIIIDCGSIPETLIESELFGHIKGAFTGAQGHAIGKIQAANGGILVLDEIGELPIGMQPKLLRFVQEKQFTPIGGNKPVKVDVKIVAVTNRDLAFEVSQGRFRKDLFYRLNVVTLHNPALRERVEDIDLLCQHFLSKFSRQFEMDKKYIGKDTVDRMRRYSWPGNIRELENKLMQASLLTTSDEILYDDLNLDAVENLSNQSKSKTHAHMPQNTNSTLEHATEIRHNNFANTVLQANPPPAEQRDHTNNAGNTADALSPEQWCQQFSICISNLLDSLSMQTMLTLAIANTIELVLLNMAHKEQHSHAKTAVLLQLPTSTARRKLQKPAPNITMLENDANWYELVVLLEQLVGCEVYLDAPLDLIRNLIAQSILKNHSTNMALASQLMGVSEPTMYKFRKQLQHQMS